MIALLALLSALPALANCEAGGYMIHTVAEYGKPGPGLELMTYELKGDTLTAKPGATFEEQARATFREAKAAKLSLGKELCTPKTAWKYAEDQESTTPEIGVYSLDLSPCKGFAARLAARGYLTVKPSDGTATFGKKLEVKDAKADTHAELRKFAAADARKRKLERPGRLFEGKMGWESGENVPLKPEDIKGSESRVVEIGGFRMITEVLHLSPLPPLPKEQKEVTESSSAPLAAGSGKLVTYPVLYFTAPMAKEPRYIGDGSYCSSNIGIKGDPSDKGKFTVTNAFDFDFDGNPDLLEVNERFAYWLDDKGVPLVVNYGQGC